MRKKFTVKKIVLLSILVLIISVIGFVANAFTGNPISKALAKYEYKRYVEETYPNTDFKVSKARYNFKDMNYWAEVTSESKKLKFNVSKRYDDIIEDDYRDKPTLADNETSFRFREEIKSEIMKAVEADNKILLLKDIYVDLTFPQGKYDKASKFSRDIDEEIKIQVNLSRENLKEKAINEGNDKEETGERVSVKMESKKEDTKIKKNSVKNKVTIPGKTATKEVVPKPGQDGVQGKDKIEDKDKMQDKEIENEEKVIVVDEDFIEEAYKVKEIIINMGYTGLTEIGFQFQDDSYNYEYISLNKEQFDTPKEELVNFKSENSSIYEKDGDEEVYLSLENDIRLALHDVKNIEYIMVYDNKLGGSTGNITVDLKILKEVKPTREELAKETFEIKELIKNKYPEIKYLNINFYEYGEINVKDSRAGQYYGSIFIGNDFAPLGIKEEEINTKLKVWNEI